MYKFHIIIIHLHDEFCVLTKRMCMVIEYTRCRVKIKSKLTNLKINSRIEGYNGKQG